MANERQTAPQSDIKLLISKGLEQGYLTYAEVNDHLPDDMVDPEQIEDIIGMINGMGIEVHEVAPDIETLLLAGQQAGGREVDETAAEEAAAALTSLDTEGGRTTDPVRMYMREMGTVNLLTREGEIAIAKRIEEGLAQMNAALATFPATIEAILADWEQHKAGKKRLADFVVGFNDDQLADDGSMDAADELAADADEGADADEDEDEDGGEADEPTPTGPDPVEVANRLEAIAADYARFVKAVAKGGPDAKPAIKARADMAAVFVTLKLPLPLTDALVKNLRDSVTKMKEHERRILDLSTRVAKMPRKDFIKAW
ncbi:MAG: RNA polymerase sigma factor RpoD, partial [Proteobacteria bacterium]|nr:RNA polymerase sigma factor RpoD [Pseudomonadota bacterium]